MNLGLFLSEEQYQTTIYLNDRAYEVLDIGEGNCLIVVVNSIRDYTDMHKDLMRNQRVIAVDITQVLYLYGEHMALLEQYLADDLHLLLDVFWLEEVEIRCEVDGLNLDKLKRLTAIRGTLVD